MANINEDIIILSQIKPVYDYYWDKQKEDSNDEFQQVIKPNMWGPQMWYTLHSMAFETSKADNTHLVNYLNSLVNKSKPYHLKEVYDSCWNPLPSEKAYEFDSNILEDVNDSAIKFVVPDVRFQNEIDAINEFDTYKWKPPNRYTLDFLFLVNSEGKITLHHDEKKSCKPELQYHLHSKDVTRMDKSKNNDFLHSCVEEMYLEEINDEKYFVNKNRMKYFINNNDDVVESVYNLPSKSDEDTNDENINLPSKPDEDTSDENISSQLVLYI